MCRLLEYADLREARKLKALGEQAFAQCPALKHVLLNDGLEIIGSECFNEA